MTEKKTVQRRPEWLKVRLGKDHYQKVRRMLKDAKLHTVCQEANCPNIGECFDSGTATFLIMGDRCTRNCSFCNIKSAKPEFAPDPDEPRRLAETVVSMGLEYVVVTSVTRDDVADGGADHFAKTIHAIRDAVPGVKVEVLIPDMKGKEESLMTVLAAKPDVLNHNVETIPRLYRTVRPGSIYERSLELLRRSAATGATTKSGIMVGLGETMDEIKVTIKDIVGTGAAILTVGQYLQPSREHIKLERYWTPEEFKEMEIYARDVGFKAVESGPLVRSSYHAAKTVEEVNKPGCSK